MNPTEVILMMTCSSILAAWWFDRKTHVSQYKDAIQKMIKSAEDGFKITKQIELIHNEQTKTLIDMGRRLEDVAIKVNTSQLFSPKR